MANTTLKVGDKAPAFQLDNQDGEKVGLVDLKGRYVVLYFYPKDNTPGCTIEAIDFTARVKDFDALNAEVLGVSPDTPRSHCNFIDKQHLQIALLSDPEHEVLEKYGVWQKKKNYGKEYEGVVRSTFLIDPEGVIAHIWSPVKVEGHAEAVLEKIKSLAS